MLNKPVVYLDMDGVISDFAHHYYKYEPLVDTPKKFHTMVSEFSIFEHLYKMPNADKVIDLVFNQLDVNVAILSSLGTHTPEIAEKVKVQKEAWLDRHGIICPRYFVNSWAYKKQYAATSRVMIDDRHDVIQSFTEAGGLGVQYIDEEWTQMEYKIRQAVTRAQQLLKDNNANLYV